MHRDPDGVPFLMGKDVGPGFLISNDLDRVTEAFHRSQPKSQLRAGDVVVVRIGKSGQAAKVPESLGEANCSGLVIVKQPTGVNVDFLVYYLNSPLGRQQSVSQARGSTRLTLNTGSVAEMPVPVPPRAEQRRIVAVLDEAFASVATARANTEQNLRNARALYGRVLDSLFDEGVERWGRHLVGDLAERVTKGTTPTSIGFNFEPDGPVNFIKIEAISADGEIIRERLAQISVDCHQALRRSQLEENDVLFSIAGALGRTVVVSADLLPANTNQALAIIRLKPSADLLPEFLVRALATSVAAAQTDQLKAGAAQQNLSLAQLRGFEVPVPTRSEQERVVEQLRWVRTVTLGLSGLYGRKLAVLDELKQSLFHQAFTGAL
jgi:type I restriction enzyme S subunit